MTGGRGVALALLDPVALAATLALWLPAALLVGRVQDDPSGPAPRVTRAVAVRLTAVLAAAVGLVVLQTVAAGVVLAAGAGHLVPDLSWPALAALLTAAAGAGTSAAPVLRRQLRGRPVTDVARWAGSLATVRAGAPAGVLAVLLAVAAPASPRPATGGPTVLPAVLAAASVLAARRFLHTTALVRAPRHRPVAQAVRRGSVPRPRAAVADRAAARRPDPAAGRPAASGVPPSPACAWTTSPTPPRPTG